MVFPLDRFTGARIWMRDDDYQIIMIWYGGHGIHAYDTRDGKEVAFWNVGNWAKNAAHANTVRASMKARLRNHDYEVYA